jgi:hypothetical protein
LFHGSSETKTGRSQVLHVSFRGIPQEHHKLVIKAFTLGPLGFTPDPNYSKGIYTLFRIIFNEGHKNILVAQIFLIDNIT